MEPAGEMRSKTPEVEIPRASTKARLIPDT